MIWNAENGDISSTVLPFFLGSVAALWIIQVKYNSETNISHIPAFGLVDSHTSSQVLQISLLSLTDVGDII